MPISPNPILLAAVLLLAIPPLHAPAAPPESPLRIAWTDADHPSGTYYAKAPANLHLTIENPSANPLPLEGSIAFGIPGKTPADFKPLSLTPINPTPLDPHQRVKLPLALTFAAAGPYELRWIHPDKSFTLIENPASVPLQAIFAPRTGNTAATPWLTTLPRQAALIPGYLPDLVAQTTIRKFLLDERFAFDPATNLALGVGASLAISADQAQSLFADLSKANAALILRITVPIDHPPDAKTLKAFRLYIADSAFQTRGSLKALAIVPESSAPFTAEQRTAYRDFYLAAYETAKKHDKNIALLGAGSAQATRNLLLTPSQPGKSDDLRPYIDALAITDLVGQPPIAAQLRADSKLPLWILPPNSADPWPLVPSAAALAEQAVVVPAPPSSVDHGVTAHLLGGAVFFQKVRPANLPYLATFQGDGYAVAAIAGLAANTPLDAAYPALARTRSVVQPADNEDKPVYPSIEVPDDTRSLRVVDATGSPVECRSGDMLFVPASDRIVYLLQTGNAEDLAALLRPALVNRLPVMEITLTAAAIIDGDAKKPAVTLRLTNITQDEIGGNVKIIVPAAGDRNEPLTLAENAVVPLSPGKTLELTLPLSGELPTTPVIVEVTTRHAIQRTAVRLGDAPPADTQPRG